MISKTKRSLATIFLPIGVLAAGLLFGGTNAIACTTAGWDADIATPIADGPPAQGRYAGVCSMKTDPSGGVKTIAPAGEDMVNARFYIFAQGITGSPVVFEAFSDDDATASLLSITFDGSDFVFEASDGASAGVPGTTGWNSVEIAWIGDTGMDYWVNTSSQLAATGSVSAAGTGMQSAILGAPASATGTIVVDALEMRRTTMPDRLVVCDANGSGVVNFDDILTLTPEIFSNPKVYATGTPDCNENGVVNFDDILAAVALIFPAP